MTPKEKAQELVKKMYQHQWRKDTIEFLNAKKSALIAVDELQKECTIYNPSPTPRFDYWKNVKLEIEKL